MYIYFIFSFLLVLVGAQQNYEEKCLAMQCMGEGYECIEGNCYCAIGYIPNAVQSKCIKCPGKGESCYGTCCNPHGNGSLQCWQGVCVYCYDQHGVWTCRDSLDQILLVSITQVAMATALVLAIIATFVLLYKFCSVADMRNMNTGSQGDGRLSIGSLQVYVEQRLRDAPPSYTRAATSGSSIIPAPFFVNAGFIHDSSIPPPPYSPPERKEEEGGTPAIHM